MMHKFLAKGAIGPFSGFPWPEARGGVPGAWIDVDGPLAPCARGVHVCRPVDLAHWIHDELWELETEGDPISALDCVVVRGARLVRRVEGWNDVGRARFSEACVEHAGAQLGEWCPTPLDALGEGPETALPAREGASSPLSNNTTVSGGLDTRHLGQETTSAVRELLDDARFMAEHGYVALTAFTSAVVVSRLGAERDPAYGRERAWQSAWITEHFLAPRPL